MADGLGDHRLEHAQGADDVVAIVAHRIANRFADVEQRGEVHHRRNLVPRERLTYRRHVRDIGFDQLAVSNRLPMAGHEVVQYDDPVARAAQRLRRMAPDVSGAARDEDRAPFSAQWRNT